MNKTLKVAIANENLRLHMMKLLVEREKSMEVVPLEPDAKIQRTSISQAAKKPGSHLGGSPVERLMERKRLLNQATQIVKRRR